MLIKVCLAHTWICFWVLSLWVLMHFVVWYSMVDVDPVAAFKLAWSCAPPIPPTPAHPMLLGEVFGTKVLLQVHALCLALLQELPHTDLSKFE